MNNIKMNTIAIFLIVAAILVVSSMAYINFLGSLGPFLLFNLSYLLVLSSCFLKPRIYAYTFFGFFLFLGFWLKFMAHMIIGYDFIEPIGQFDNTQESWDRVLNVASIAALSVFFVKVFLFAFQKNKANNEFIKISIPSWYKHTRIYIWSFTLLAILIVNILNVWGAFYQIGINTKVILPFHLNIIFSWLINIGFGIWMSTLIYWETCLNKKKVSFFIMFGIFEAMLSTITSLSRSIYLFRTLPYFFVLIQTKLKYFCNKKTLIGLFLTFTVCFAVGLVSVTLLRAPLYLSLTSEANQLNTGEVNQVNTGEANQVNTGEVNQLNTSEVNQVNTNELIVEKDSEKLDQDSTIVGNNLKSISELPTGLLQGAFKQVVQLTVDRWIGIEGVMAVSAYPSHSFNFFMEAIKENPENGVLSIYQKISNSEYTYSDDFTFLTLPGIVSILYYSGSYTIVFFGMMLLTWLMVITEFLANKFIYNPFLLSVTGLSMANVLSQLNFPYLALVFILQLWIALLFVWFIQEKLGGIRVLGIDLKRKNYQQPF